MATRQAVIPVSYEALLSLFELSAQEAGLLKDDEFIVDIDLDNLVEYFDEDDNETNIIITATVDDVEVQTITEFPNAAA